MRKNYLLVALFAILSLSVGAREKQDGWKQLGTGTFCDDMFSAIDESFLATWDVEIEESETTPGYYRLVNPFGNGNCPYFGDKNNFKTTFISTPKTQSTCGWNGRTWASVSATMAACLSAVW